MDISWVALLALPTLITPAFVMYLIFRFNIPKLRSAPHNDFLFILTFISLNLFINFSFAHDYIQSMIMNWLSMNPSSDIKDITKLILPANDPGFSFAVARWMVGNTLIAFLMDLHLRAALFSLFLSIGFDVAERVDDFYWGYPSKKNKTCKDKIVTAFGKILGYKHLDSAENLLSEQNGGWFKDILSNIKFNVVDSWNLEFQHNKSIEVLIADVMAADESLYQGLLVNYSSKNNDLSSLTLHNVFRYYPEKPKKDEPKEETYYKGKKDKSKSSNAQKNKGKPKSNRRWKLIPNNGELILKEDQIKTIHLWKLRKGVSVKLVVTDSNYFEQLKWYYGIMHNRPDIIGSLHVEFVTTQEELNSYRAELKNWISDSGFDFEEFSKVTYEENIIVKDSSH